jgi:uncharacterized protein (TIGR02996 family)
MKHPDWPAFVAAIVVEPDEDAVRLVAADFLEENGDASRAAFIRVQIALARLETAGQGHTSEAGELRKQELTFSPRFWAAEDCPEFFHGTQTQAGSLALRVKDGVQLTWRRGFVDRVACPTTDWLQHGAAVRKRNPVRGVVLLDSEGVSREAWLAGLDALRGLRWVELKYQMLAGVDSVAQGTELAVWLRERLSGTPVNMEIRPWR